MRVGSVRLRIIFGVLLGLSALSVAPAGAEVVQAPNLVPLPPFQVRAAPADGVYFPGPDMPLAIRFSVATMNAGAYALEMRGVPKDASEVGPAVASKSAQQCIWWVSRACTSTREAGRFIFHQAHGHWHIEDYALYELRKLTEEGTPDLSDAGLVAPAKKASFCLIDVAQAVRQPPGHDPLATVPVYQVCSEYVEGISPGWADIYDWTLEGQQFPLGGIPDGRYAIVVKVNIARQILETTYEDNQTFTAIEVFDGGTEVVEV